MNGVKPWQIVVMVLAVVVVIGSSFYSCSRMGGGEPKQATEATMVDIRTGELFVAKYPEKRPVTYPAKNPSTGTDTLFRVYAKEQKWVLDTRYLGTIRADKALKADLIVDGKTGEVQVTNPKPTRSDIFGK